MNRNPPAFQFYAKDWLSSATVRTMSMHHRGIYITVLAAMWDSDEPGTLPLPLEVSARSAGIDPRSLRDFMAKSPRCLVEIDGKLVNKKLRDQWNKLLEFKQSQADAARRTNEKLGRKPSVSESVSDTVSDRTASAFASATAEEGDCSLMQLSQDHTNAKLQEPVPTRSQVEKAIKGAAKRMGLSATLENAGEGLDQRRRFLQRQGEEVQKKYKSAV
jgi:hypothetical protein